MKKVIHTTEKTVALQSVLDTKMPVIGFQHEGIKTTFIPLKYNGDKYLARCFNSWEKGNGYGDERTGSAAKTIEEWEILFPILHKAEMFIFDSPKEMFEWFAE